MADSCFENNQSSDMAKISSIDGASFSVTKLHACAEKRIELDTVSRSTGPDHAGAAYCILDSTVARNTSFRDC